MDKQWVLVVEDEALVLLTIKDALQEAGFAVTASASVGQAIDHLGDQGETPFVALVTDINFPEVGATGWDVAHTARDGNGALAVVYTTGAASDDWPANGVPNSILVTKPFAPAQIVTAVSQLLNAAPAAGS